MPNRVRRKSKPTTSWIRLAFRMRQYAMKQLTLWSNAIPDAHICKNLFLCNRQQTQFYLLMLPGDKHFNTKFLSTELGCARLSFAEERQMTALLGIHPGSVSPLGLMNDTEKKVMLVVDKDLLNTEHSGCHPCINTSTLKLSIRNLLEKFVPSTGHEYKVVTLQ